MEKGDMHKVDKDEKKKDCCEEAEYSFGFENWEGKNVLLAVKDGALHVKGKVTMIFDNWIEFVPHGEDKVRLYNREAILYIQADIK